MQLWCNLIAIIMLPWIWRLVSRELFWHYLLYFLAVNKCLLINNIKAFYNIVFCCVAYSYATQRLYLNIHIYNEKYNKHNLDVSWNLWENMNIKTGKKKISLISILYLSYFPVIFFFAANKCIEQGCHQESPLTDERIALIFYWEYEIGLKNECWIRLI